jgi:hypothetical protein
MRVVLWILPVLTSLSGGAAHPQSAGATPSSQGSAAAVVDDRRSADAPEEIVVRGRRLEEFRLEVEKLRVRAYDIFNEINSTDDFDIRCESETRTGTRLERQVCVARFENRISSRASKDYMAAIKTNCLGGLTQDCIFDPAVAGHGIVAAKGVEGEAPHQRALLNQELHRLARTDLRLGQAILDFYDASLEYEEERKRPRERRRAR